MNKVQKEKELSKIALKVAECRRCSLYRQAVKPVPGQGSPEAEVVFIGEGPGYHEDQSGIPFCGAAGKLLDRLLASIGINRQDVWIGNVVKHRPPGNRDPSEEEIKACCPFLDEQIKIIKPKIIITLGRFSMGKFLPGEYISRIHGQPRYIDFQGQRYVLIPMYHPAAGLRSQKIMESLKEDFNKINLFLKPEAEKETELSEPLTKNGEQLSLIN